MKVKLFQDIDIDSLEKKINDWLESNPDITIIDIRFSSTAHAGLMKVCNYLDKVIVLYK